jgi:plasmid stabilization system protein ParE
MVEKIEWSNKFVAQVKSIIMYLRENSTDDVVENFKQKLEKKIVQLAKYPTAHRQVANKKNIRFSNFMKKYQIFYTVRGNTFYIVSIFDTRQNPSKRPY